MPTWTPKASGLRSNNGWTNTTVSNLTALDAVYVNGGTAGDTVEYDLDNVPADFGFMSAGGFTINVYARVIGTVQRQKTLTINLFDSTGANIGSSAFSIIGSTRSLYQSVIGPNLFASSEEFLNGLYFNAVVTEGSGMPDSASVEVDYIELVKDYFAASSATASGGIGTLNASSVAGSATGSTDVNVNGLIGTLNASTLAASVTTSSAASGVISALSATSPAASGSGAATASGELRSASASPLLASAYAVNSIDALIGFTDPPGEIVGAQEFRVLVRRSANNPLGSGVPTVSVSLYEAGVFKQLLLSGVSVTDDVQQLLSVFWDASLITDKTGFSVQLYVQGTAGGSGVNARSVDIGAAEWNSAYKPLANVKASGAWKHAVSYIKVSGVWTPSLPKVKDQGLWN